MRVCKHMFGASVALNAVLVASMVLLSMRSGFTGLGSSMTRGGLRQMSGSRSIKNIRPNVNLKECRTRIESVKNTKKITSSMKLVAAAKVRKAQAAVLGGRAFSEFLVQTLFGINQKVKADSIESKLTEVRPVKNVLLIGVSGDRGLCGGYNTFILKKTLARAQELKDMGIGVKFVTVGNKINNWFKRRTEQYDVMNGMPLADLFGNKAMSDSEQADALATFTEEILASYLDGEVDKVEIVYTKFKSLIGSDPIIQTLLPLSPQGEICDVNGNCVDAADDEIFKLTTKDGDLAVETEKVTIPTSSNDFNDFIFEQPPNELIDAILPLYMDSIVLRAFQESLAAELAARMNAMGAACDNADDLQGRLQKTYNRGRQTKITNEILEIVSGANAV